MSEIVEKSNPKLTVAENTNSSSTGELQKCSGKDNLSHLLGTRPKYDPRIPWLSSSIGKGRSTFTKRDYCYNPSRGRKERSYGFVLVNRKLDHVSKGMKNSNPDQQQFGGSNEQSDFSKSIKAKIKIPCGTPTAKASPHQRLLLQTSWKATNCINANRNQNDKGMGKMIGHAREQKGLYYLEELKDKEKDLFLLDLPSHSHSFGYAPKHRQPSSPFDTNHPLSDSSKSNLVHLAQEIQQRKTSSRYNSSIIGYSIRTRSIDQPMQIQELEPAPSIEITSSFESHLEMNSSSNDGNLPIAIQKAPKRHSISFISFVLFCAL
ncbi:hypothetical protein CK203_087111 [Vitis vinifera]|uniref:Uncharacterized protein n=1 Tax=Vitis vinifera TaxID=29760 RepID=A0A438EAL0_VITVI|nr:hypothetical protein CK203_087111 [Vitis vinifera]